MLAEHNAGAKNSGSHEVDIAPNRQVLLRLPSAVRHRIYDHVGIGVRTEPTTSGQHRHLPVVHLRDLNRNRLGQQNLPPLGFHGLLLSCRMIYDEASLILYSTNFFLARYDRSEQRTHGPGRSLRLSCLGNLRPASLQALRHLKIVLAEASCHHEDCRNCCANPGGYFDHHKPGCFNEHHDHGDPLDAGPSTDRLLAGWDSVAAHFASYVIPGNLDLAVVCDVRPTEAGMLIARAAVASLLRLPRLRKCHLRLSPVPHTQLQQLAHDTVMQARGVIVPPTPPKSPSLSPFVTLPRELRLRVLSYTDLVTPWREVLWSRQQRGFVLSYTYCGNIGPISDFCPPSRHHGCQFLKCWIGYPRSSFPGCFCRAKHSASASPAPCQCWTPRGAQALFLVCRSLLEDARSVFFSENRFVVHDGHANPPDRADIESLGGAGIGNSPAPETEMSETQYPFACLGASVFLRHVVPAACLGHLRFLELAFPPYDSTVWPQRGHPALKDWAETLGWATGSDNRGHHQLNLSALTLRVVMPKATVGEYGEYYPQSWMYATKDDDQDIVTSYWCILRPLSRLLGGDVRRFYAQVSWPSSLLHGRTDTEENIEKENADLRKRAETFVMGKRYKSVQNRSEEPPRSIWQQRMSS